MYYISSVLLLCSLLILLPLLFYFVSCPSCCSKYVRAWRPGARPNRVKSWVDCILHIILNWFCNLRRVSGGNVITCIGRKPFFQAHSWLCITVVVIYISAHLLQSNKVFSLCPLSPSRLLLLLHMELTRSQTVSYRQRQNFFFACYLFAQVVTCFQGMPAAHPVIFCSLRTIMCRAKRFNPTASTVFGRKGCQKRGRKPHHWNLREWHRKHVEGGWVS